MPKVSVIIPVYGVEKYIERCARSLFEQTIDDIEYIFVNDCTNDTSIEVLQSVIEEYPNRKSQIKILHHETNKGLPQARRTGVLSATGEYIAHCDSDDWVDIEIYEKMYKVGVDNNSDIVICDCYSTDCKYFNLIKGALSCKKDDLLLKMFTRDIPFVVWNKLVKRKLYVKEGFVYPLDNMGEDAVLVVQFLKNANNVSYIEEPLYFYYYNVNSITNSVSDIKIRQKFVQATSNASLIESFFTRKDSPCLRMGVVKYIYEQSYLLVKLAKHNNDDLKSWVKSIENIKSEVYKCPYLSIYNKVFFYFLLLKNSFLNK